MEDRPARPGSSMVRQGRMAHRRGFLHLPAQGLQLLLHLPKGLCGAGGAPVVQLTAKQGQTGADGVEAITQYLNRGNYTQILADLKAGAGLMSDSSLASEISLYSGGGYSTIPDSFGQSQGQPLS